MTATLRLPIPAVAALSLGFVACSDQSVPIEEVDLGFDSTIRDTGSSDAGSRDTAGGGMDATTEVGPSDTGADDPAIDVAADSTTDTDAIADPEFVTAFCNAASECEDDPASYLDGCEDRAVLEMESKRDLRGQECLDAYLSYWECLLENLECGPAKEGPDLTSAACEFPDGTEACP